MSCLFRSNQVFTLSGNSLAVNLICFNVLNTARSLTFVELPPNAVWVLSRCDSRFRIDDRWSFPDAICSSKMISNSASISKFAWIEPAPMYPNSDGPMRIKYRKIFASPDIGMKVPGAQTKSVLDVSFQINDKRSVGSFGFDLNSPSRLTNCCVSPASCFMLECV